MLLMRGCCWLLRCLMLMFGGRRLSCCFLGHRLTGGLNCMTFVSITHRRIMLHWSSLVTSMSSRLHSALAMSLASHTRFGSDTSPCCLRSAGERPLFLVLANFRRRTLSPGMFVLCGHANHGQKHKHNDERDR